MVWRFFCNSKTTSHPWLLWRHGFTEIFKQFNTDVSKNSFWTQIILLQSCVLWLYAFLPSLIGWVKWGPTFYDLSICPAISLGREFKWGQGWKCIPHGSALWAVLSFSTLMCHLICIWFKVALNCFLLFSSLHYSLILCGIDENTEETLTPNKRRIILHNNILKFNS